VKGGLEMPLHNVPSYYLKSGAVRAAYESRLHGTLAEAGLLLAGTVSKRTFEQMLSFHAGPFSISSIRAVGQFLGYCYQDFIDFGRGEQRRRIPCDCRVCTTRQNLLAVHSFNTLRIADCNFIVIRAILRAWGLESLLAISGVQLALVPTDIWGDLLLDYLGNGLDGAIYNKVQAEEYIKRHPYAGLQIVREFGSSMSGRNFYVLGPRNLLRPGAKPAVLLDAARGMPVYLPRDSDIHRAFLRFFNIKEETLRKRYDIKLLDNRFPDAMSVALAREALVLSGQNLRLFAKDHHAAVEVLNSDSFLNSGIRAHAAVTEHAKNALVIHNSLHKRFPGIDFSELADRAWNHFQDSWRNNKIRGRLLNELADSMVVRGVEQQRAARIVREVVKQSYGFSV
jgi:hypothetical protein